MGAAAGVDGIGLPATLIVNRDPLPVRLPPCGAGIDVTVTPPRPDVDRTCRFRVWGAGVKRLPVPAIEYYHAEFTTTRQPEY
jgi:hypothetical protein